MQDMKVNNKLKVLIVHNYYQIPGGEDTVVANEKRMLEDHGHKVILYNRNNLELKVISKFRKVLLPCVIIFNLRTYREVMRIIRENEIDIVHVHNTLPLISPSVYYAAYSMNVPIIQTIHNYRFLCPGATFYRNGHICEECMEKGLGCAVKYGCYRKSRMQTLVCVINAKIHRLTGIYGKLNYICLTEFIKNKMLNIKQIKPDNVFVKPNFMDCEAAVLPYKNRKNQFVYAGRLDKLKGIDLLFEAWKQIESEEDYLTLIICGTGPMEKWCKAYVKKNGLKTIDMRGFVSNIEARRIIAESKALILPTQWYETFPMTIVEAYSVGTPVIISDIDNVGNLIEEGVTGYRFKHNSAEHLKEVMTKSDFDICDSTIKEYQIAYTGEINYLKLINIYMECRAKIKK